MENPHVDAAFATHVFAANPLNTVLYGKYAGTELEFEGKKYLIMRQSDVLAVLA